MLTSPVYWTGMFEGNILNLGMVASLPEAEVGAASLHVLSWPELVARLGAARDYHRHLTVNDHIDRGSFHFASARYIAAFSQRKPGINPFALADHKSVVGMVADMSPIEWTGDRGRQ